MDVLENYCLAFGVDGRDWVGPDPWRFKHTDDQSFDEPAINRIRDRAIELLLNLRRALCPDGDADHRTTAGGFTQAVFAFLDALHVRDTVGQWVDDAHQAGDPTRADEHRQFYDKLIDIFEDLVTVFPRDTMTASDYLAIMNLAFSQMTLAFIPPSLDQVLVGSIERSRHPNLKAVFLLGVTQKQFPIPIPSGGVLTDGDRDAAEAAGFHLAPSTTQSLAERQYLAYIAFTRPSDLLCISYPAVDEKGSPVVPSHFIDELTSLFDDVTEELTADSPSDLAHVQTQPGLAELLSSRLGRDAFAPEADSEQLRDLLDAMQTGNDHSPAASVVARALDYDNHAALCPDTVKRLFARQLKGSATSLATFAACPFKYFAKYTLDLKERREFKLEPLDLGNFYHAMLDQLHRHLVADGLDFATAQDDHLTRLLGEQIEAHVNQDAFISKFVSRSDHNAFIIANAAEVLTECVLEVAQMARAGAFHPVLSEVGFGQPRDAQENLGAFEMPLPSGRVLTLRGTIDRLDIAEVDGRRIALVFDYKRSEAATQFSWSQFYHGLNVQLPLYLLALSRMPQAQVDSVAGAFCLPIESSPAAATLEQLPQKSDSFRRKAKGFFNGDHVQHLDHEVQTGWSRLYNFCITKGDAQYGRYANSGALNPDDFDCVLQFTRDKIIALASGIAAGQIDVYPYRLGTQTACAHCDFKAICHFDWQVNDYNSLTSVSKLDVIASPKPS
ncbi:MAG: PD-(D/E)XK nuclease family protein [Planctomycetota bacterium]